MAAGRVRRSDRPRAVALAWLLAVLMVLGAVPVAAASVPGLGSGLGPGLGIAGGGTSFVDASMASSLVQSAFGLSAVDLHSGGLHGGDVTQATALDQAVGMDLAEQGLMAVDLNRVAEQARLEAERKRAAAEAAAERRGVALERSSDPGVPESWEVKNFSSCGHPANAGFQARIELVELWEVLCRDAAAAGVHLIINSAYRSPAHQRRLFTDAVAQYGSAAAARNWVAYSDGTSCSSRHCSGSAIDVSLSRSPGAQSWLHATVGCATGQGVALGGGCDGAGRAVKRVQLYGLIFPLPHEPWHLELGLVAGRVEGDCAPPGSHDVPRTIAAVWRCRLTGAGLSAQEVDRTVAEALVVSKCESGWDTNAVAFGGRYRRSPHPTTGMRYTAAGLFQFIRASANTWVDGGYANVHDPVANADAAARYWLDGYRRGGRTAAWNPWACAAVNDGFATASVLPGFPGGPAALPSWATGM